MTIKEDLWVCSKAIRAVILTSDVTGCILASFQHSCTTKKSLLIKSIEEFQLLLDSSDDVFPVQIEEENYFSAANLLTKNTGEILDKREIEKRYLFPLQVKIGCSRMSDDRLLILLGIISSLDEIASQIDGSTGLSHASNSFACFQIIDMPESRTKIIIISKTQINKTTLNIFEKK